jgi:hypothetical protein
MNKLEPIIICSNRAVNKNLPVPTEPNQLDHSQQIDINRQQIINQHRTLVIANSAVRSQTVLGIGREVKIADVSKHDALAVLTSATRRLAVAGPPVEIKAYRI